MKLYQTRANGEFLNMFRASCDESAVEVFKNYCREEARFLVGDSLELVTKNTIGGSYVVTSEQL